MWMSNDNVEKTYYLSWNQQEKNNFDKVIKSKAAVFYHIVNADFHSEK